MAIVINGTNSINSAGNIIFSQAENVVVQHDGYLISSLTSMLLTGTTASNYVYNYGSVVSSGGPGISLQSNASLSYIGIGTSGVASGTSGLFLSGPVGAIYNNGIVKGRTFDAIYYYTGGDSTVNNSGVISGLTGIGYAFNATGTHTINNTATGRIESFNATFAVFVDGYPLLTSSEIINNAGTIAGSLSLQKGRDTINVTGNGIIQGTVAMGDDADTVTISGNGSITGRVDLGAGNDTYTGGALKDDVYGGTGADTINGNAGNDLIYGYLEADTIKAGAGADNIIGGAARDSLMGGSVVGGNDGARDYFIYSAITDSGSAFATADVIWDFNAGTAATADRILLAAIDAKSGTATNDAFTWIGTAAFSGVAGQLRQATNSGFTVVYGDVNGDRVADIAIDIYGIKTLAATDFVL